MTRDHVLAHAYASDAAGVLWCADLEDEIDAQNDVNCANRAYNCDFDSAAIVLSAFNMGMLICFLLAWAVCIARAREHSSALLSCAKPTRMCSD